MWRGLVPVVFAMALWVTLLSQQPDQRVAGQPLTFEVASVKPNRTGASNMSAGVVPAGYAATNVPLRFLIAAAFGVRRGQLIGGPGWIDVERFDIVARAPEGAPPGSMLPRLQELLRERFKLVTHVETREQPIYALVRLTPTGPLPSGLRPSTFDCSAPAAAPNPCRVSGTIGAVAGSVKANGQTMSDFVAYLGANVDRVVVDRTGLSGRFDFELAWTADDVRGLAVDGGGAEPEARGAVLFTALREQLGLKLDSTRGPVEFLVIDSADALVAD